MNISNWIDRAWDTLPKCCYISIQLIDDHYDLEVETSLDTIGGVYGTGRNDLDYARDLADELENELNKRGVNVCYTRQEWEIYLNIAKFIIKKSE